jgi:hypothetical protein
MVIHQPVHFPTILFSKKSFYYYFLHTCSADPIRIAVEFVVIVGDGIISRPIVSKSSDDELSLGCRER